MNALLIALSLATPQADTSATKVSAMLSLYHDASSISGTIEWAQMAQNTKVFTNTHLQIDREGRRVYIDQIRNSESAPGRWTVTANGKVMTYPNFDGGPGPKRLKESMVPAGYSLTEKDVLVASSRSLGDRDIPINILFARKEDLQRMRWQLKSLAAIREEDLNGEKVSVVGGEYVDTVGSSPGKYEFWIGPKNELRRFVREESTRVPLETAQKDDGTIMVTRWSDPVIVLNQWTLKIETGGKLDERLFQIIN